MNILLITHYYPPLDSSAVYRCYSWAKYWARSGHRVTVLTTKKRPSHGSLTFLPDLELPDRLQVCEIDYGFLWKLKTGRHTPANTSVGNPFKQKLKYLVRGIYFDYFGLLLERYLLWIFPAVKAARVLAQNRPFDVLVSSFTPGASHWIARRLKREWGTPWMADFRDLWAGNPVAPGAWPFSPLVRALEHRAVAQADLFSTVSDPLAETLTKVHGKPCVVLENGFDEEEFSHLSPGRFYSKDGKLRFIYAGAIYPGKRDPSPLFAAVNALIEQGRIHRDQIELMFYGNKAIGIRQIARNFHLDDVVKTPGRIDRRSILRAQRDADGLIFLDWDDPSTDGILTGKLFEYLRSARPILGIGNTPASASSRLMLRAGVGFPLGNNVDAIARFLLENYITGNGPHVAPQWDVICRYNRETLAQKALQHLVDLAGRAQPSGKPRHRKV